MTTGFGDDSIRSSSGRRSGFGALASHASGSSVVMSAPATNVRPAPSTTMLVTAGSRLAPSRAESSPSTTSAVSVLTGGLSTTTTRAAPRVSVRTCGCVMASRIQTCGGRRITGAETHASCWYKLLSIGLYTSFEGCHGTPSFRLQADTGRCSPPSGVASAFRRKLRCEGACPDFARRCHGANKEVDGRS